METTRIKVALLNRIRKRKRDTSHDVRAPNLPKKMKLSAPGASTSTPDDLPWKKIAKPRSLAFAGAPEQDGAVLILEELDGVDVQYEMVEGGSRVAKFVPTDLATSSSTRKHVPRKILAVSRNITINEDFDHETLLPDWENITLSPHLKRSLHKLGFKTPTEIQSRAINPGLKGKDVVGVAETGSGKTLAYSLPILNSILANIPQQHGDLSHQLTALILAPTRELALQVVDHIKAVIEPPREPDEEGERGPRIRVAAIVGGMSVQKQKRLIESGLDIIVATPGRLWDVLNEDDELAAQIPSIKFLVLDEADRMIEAGHFQELESIVKLTLRPAKLDEDSAEMEQDPVFASEPKNNIMNDTLQTFVFSATLSQDLQRNLKKRKGRKPDTKKRKDKDDKPATTLDDLLMRLDFRDPEPEVIDLSPEGGSVSTLRESKIECLTADKDVFLYYFLLRYPGRSLVFVGSIDGIRRLIPLLELLQLKVFPLHSQLQQKQRLKNLDRFKSTPNSVLVATDIAARGLDVPSVDHVIHYQIPRSADIYVHRNGRTARAKKDGFSLQLIAPDEKKLVKALMDTLGRTTEIPDLPVEHDILDKLKARVAVARKIDLAQHKVKKENHERNWLKETAEAMEIEWEDDDDRRPNQTSNHRSVKVDNLKVELRALLQQPLVARGVSMKYLTSGSRAIVDDLVNSRHHENMIGLSKKRAGDDVSGTKKGVNV